MAFDTLPNSGAASNNTLTEGGLKTILEDLRDHQAQLLGGDDGGVDVSIDASQTIVPVAAFMRIGNGDLETIDTTGMVDGKVVLLQRGSGGTCTVKHNVGNIKTADEADVALFDFRSIMLAWDATEGFWYEVGRSNPAIFATTAVWTPPANSIEIPLDNDSNILFHRLEIDGLLIDPTGGSNVEMRAQLSDDDGVSWQTGVGDEYKWALRGCSAFEAKATVSGTGGTDYIRLSHAGSSQGPEPGTTFNAIIDIHNAAHASKEVNARVFCSYSNGNSDNFTYMFGGFQMYAVATANRIKIYSEPNTVDFTGGTVRVREVRA